MTDTAAPNPQSPEVLAALRLRRLAIVLAILLLTALIALVVVFFVQQRAVDVQTNIAATAVSDAMKARDAQKQAEDKAGAAQTQAAHNGSQWLGAEAINLLGTDGDTELAALLSIRALALDYAPKADLALAKANARLNGNTVKGNQSRIISDSAPIDHAIFSPDGKQIIAHTGSTLKWWDAQTGTELHKLSIEGDVAAYSTNGKLVLTTSADPAGQAWTARLIDIQTGNEVQHFSVQTKHIISVKLSADSKYLLTVGAEGPELLDPQMQLWDAQSGKELHHFTGQETAGFFSPNSKYLITVGKLRFVQLDLATLKQIRKLEANDFAVFSPDSSRMLTGGENESSVTLWNTDNGKDVGGFGASEEPAIFSPDNNSVVMNGFALHVMDVKTGVLRSQFKNIEGAAVFSPDSRLLMVADDDLAYLLDPVTGQELRVLSGHTGQVTDIAFSPDGQTLLTGSKDGTVRLWNTSYRGLITQACQRLSRDLTGEERRQYDIDDAAPTCPKPSTLTF